jgi:hemophore-related protein
MLVNVRSAVVGALGVAAVAGALLAAAPSATADPAPNCSAADRAGINAGVQAATSAYLFTHPDVNDFMTSLTGQPVDQVPANVRSYLDANPQVKAEIESIRQPLVDMRERCGAPLLDQPYTTPN